MTNRIRLLAACAFVGHFCSLTLASSQSMSGNPSPVSPNSTFAKQPGALSDKLDASNGVIRPKEVDPTIEKKPPPTGSAGLIRPQGAPGGTQGVQPK